ncbi:MAG TPA: prepilin-type N-terminal cleavage/methylation domain-containing protein [Candidatus Saccharimonadales bacterium]|nr:prepilin-type N-terminal cleavage/methylation domain-containing protein [Candidatus Saccharimonadales bacterium]
MDKRRDAGFTIVELLIVIVVIAVLASITVVAYNGVQARAKDAERTSDMQAVAKKLELFYVDNGYYPGFSQFNTAAWRQTNLPGLSDSALTPPGMSAVSLANTATPASSSQYAYRNGVICTQCAKFYLHWRSDVDGAIKTISSLN